MSMLALKLLLIKFVIASGVALFLARIALLAATFRERLRTARRT